MNAKKAKKRKIAIAKGKFTRTWKVFQAGVMKGDEVDVLKDVLKDMENADYVEELDSNDETDKLQSDEARQQMEEVYSQLAEGRATMHLHSVVS